MFKKILKITFWVVSGGILLLVLVPLFFTSPGQFDDFTFSVPDKLEPATVGKKYAYSFCQPDSARKESCDSSASNPTGGKAPYRFYEDTDSVIPLPKGLRLNLNGLLEGVPEAEGETMTGICAVDSVEDSVCKTVTFTAVKN